MLKEVQLGMTKNIYHSMWPPKRDKPVAHLFSMDSMTLSNLGNIIPFYKNCKSWTIKGGLSLAAMFRPSVSQICSMGIRIGGHFGCSMCCIFSALNMCFTRLAVDGLTRSCMVKNGIINFCSVKHELWSQYSVYMTLSSQRDISNDIQICKFSYVYSHRYR